MFSETVITCSRSAAVIYIHVHVLLFNVFATQNGLTSCYSLYHVFDSAGKPDSI